MKKQMARIFCVSLLFSSITVPIQAAQANEVQQRMSSFQKAVKIVQKKWDLYNRCVRRKCSPEEKQKIKAELKKAGKQVAIYGSLVLALIVLFYGGRWFGSGLRRLRKVSAQYALVASDKADEKLLIEFAFFKKPDLRDIHWSEISDNAIKAAAHLYYRLPFDQLVTDKQVEQFRRDHGLAVPVEVPEVKVEPPQEEQWPVPSSMKDVD